MRTMQSRLPSGEIEKKWWKKWEEVETYQPDIEKAKKPFYNLMMFPYPSAEGLHVGNMYAFTGADIFGRFQRMQGYDVFEPIGLDGFGIHSENYALKIGRHPKKQAEISQENFYRQLANIGNGFAWKNRLETYDPNYYRWTQWIFREMFIHGLAYRKKSTVNFCSGCKTVLSDEQVINGACERCKTTVEQREMEQWFFRITKYADRLLKHTLQKDFDWPEKVKIGQRNWIGKKEGIVIRYGILDSEETVECFTTRPDTNFGATFIVVAPEHELVAKIIEGRFSTEKERVIEIKSYVEETKKKSEQERIAEGRKKTGVPTDLYARNELNKKRMPIYVSDFVLGNVGTAAVVGVPGHDGRDFEFAQTFHIPVVRVVVGSDGDRSPIIQPKQVQEDEGYMVNSGFLNGMDIHEATERMMEYAEEKGWGKRTVTYKLRDWCISRQRYWGTPIPMIYCPSCASRGIGWKSLHAINNSYREERNDMMLGWYPVEDEDLPVMLPDLKDWKPKGTGKGPLAKVRTFVNTVCPECRGKAERETDVCDTFLDSSWYFLRYPFVQKKSKTWENQNRKKNLPWDPEQEKKWFPVTMYIGGAEHTVLHLLYARFITMALSDFGYLHCDEPFKKFYAHGLIISEGAKMSKSRGNVIVPDQYIQKYGADTLRSYLMFLGPFDQGGDFRDTGIAGMYKFFGRVWRFVKQWKERQDEQENKPSDREKFTSIGQEKMILLRRMHQTIKGVTEDIKHLRYNTAIAKIMEYMNELGKQEENVNRIHIETLVKLLAPFAPFVTEEIYQMLHEKDKTFTSIHSASWPVYDDSKLRQEKLTIAVQINGKLRETIDIEPERKKERDEIITRVKELPKISKYIDGKTIRKEIYVEGKIVNFVV